MPKNPMLTRLACTVVGSTYILASKKAVCSKTRLFNTHRRLVFAQLTERLRQRECQAGKKQQ